jgi:putative endonuclease
MQLSDVVRMSIPERQRARQQHEWRGRVAEIIAIWWLRLHGYQIEGHRIKTPAGEIDLVAIRHKVMVFVEVKLRPTHDMALYSVSRRQQQRIVRAAHAYVASKSPRSPIDMRFDVVTLSPWSCPRHIIDAWRPES